MIIPEILPEGAVLIEASHERRSRLVNTAWRCRGLGRDRKIDGDVSGRKILLFRKVRPSHGVFLPGQEHDAMGSLQAPI
ncbi:MULTISPECIES: hypothetical protein [Sphingobium]|uniref:Uncharacterized protein n=1 Tax=Sphingobium fuliginis (strain ATCC 27551) TaxID=336203 RepID=A0A7M2GEG3_SPHSA|nr:MULTISPECIES: hypothetical protein [Sphingobium]QOT70795.1 hypothetical protein H5V43_11780 [Sphingobium fuliginis]